MREYIRKRERIGAGAGVIGTNAIRECPQHVRILAWLRLEPPLVTRSRQMRCGQEEIKLPDGLCSFKLEDIRVRGLERLLVTTI